MKCFSYSTTEGFKQQIKINEFFLLEIFLSKLFLLPHLKQKIFFNKKFKTKLPWKTYTFLPQQEIIIT